ncbi:Protein required for ethanol metabolism [Rhodotorula mucilaginosa]|uniref:Protein required for ethanol metabolism n=1 Tax=Rhodotorula mucilaginosa TaxID=5537 RepID=A0A9P7B278_RHOMI|nr:Protein required for ethanol metabolism [Rhodotorula mucilaginosa]
MAGLLRAYNSALVRRPYATGMVSAAVLFGAGDVLAQQGIEKKGANHDPAPIRSCERSGYPHTVVRTVTRAEGLIFAPLITRVYGGIDRIRFSSKVTTTVARVAVDQFVLTPCVLSLFFTCQSLLEGKGFGEAKRRIETSWWPTIQRNWSLWIPVQAINFSIVPLHYRLLVVNFTSLFWNAYLSYANAQQGTPAEAAIKDVMGEVA